MRSAATQNNPLEIDLTEPKALLEIMRGLGVRFVNITAASPYYNPHLIRPALYPPSDGYHPPEDPFVGVMRQLAVVRDLKAAFPDFCFMGSGYTYLQEFFPNVAQAVVRLGWVDLVGLGRMMLAYPELPLDILAGRPIAEEALLPHLQRLHHGAAQRHRLRLLSARRALQEVAGIQAARHREKSPGGLSRCRGQIAFLGIGIMGSHMARRLAQGGLAVTAWNRDRAKAERLAEFGVQDCRDAIGGV